MAKEPIIDINFDGRHSTPAEKMEIAMKLVAEAFEDESRERKELQARFDALREHTNNLKAGVEVIVHMALLEDIDDRSPDEIAEAVIKRLTRDPH